MYQMIRRDLCWALLLAAVSLAGCGKSPTEQFGSAKKIEYSWGWIRWVMNSEVDPAATQTLGVVEIRAGQRNPLHMHPNCEEVMYVTAGSCENIMGGKKTVMHAGDVVRIPAGVPHQAINTGGEPLRSVVIYNTGTREMVPLNSRTTP
jgi:mannose-6-phosphate isomerase-like protein (cupin superfamily)